MGLLIIALGSTAWKVIAQRIGQSAYGYARHKDYTTSESIVQATSTSAGVFQSGASRFPGGSGDTTETRFGSFLVGFSPFSNAHQLVITHK
jgi:hypothetical protein